MFTGIVQTVGRVVAATRHPARVRLSVAASLPGEPPVLGESIAVDGVCLTLAVLRDGALHFDVVAETLSRTALGRLRPGDRVNLERSLRLGDRLGGHLLLGHVDATARVRRVSRRGGDHRISVGLAPGIRGYVAEKGSIALHGVSLTVARLGPNAFEVALIPETVERTTLGALRAGDEVHVEVDLLARYLDVLIRRRGPAGFRARGRSKRS